MTARHKAAAKMQKSLAGRLARFLRFPGEVRRAAGFQAKSTAGPVTFSLAVALQTIITTVVAAVLVAAVLRLLDLEG